MKTGPMPVARVAAAAATLALTACAGRVPPAPAPAEADAIGALERFVRREMEDKALPMVSVALVDGERVVWERGFGLARPADSVAATPATVIRAGSISKLVTDLAVMRLAERGVLQIDSPVSRYLPGLRLGDDPRQPVTLRALMAHRAGMPRETPVGHYFDPSGPTLEATAASLDGGALLYRPRERTKYSNAGVALAGYVVERVTGEPFARYVEREVLRPMGMARAAFTADSSIRAELATGHLWGYDRLDFAAPVFDIGAAPAANLYASTGDLARFLVALLDGGRGVVSRSTLEAMWLPQFEPAGATEGFGIGFYVSELDGRRQIGHIGRLYGFSTALAALPDERVGVVVATSVDAANAVTMRIAEAALRLWLAARAGRPLPAPATTAPLPAGLAGRLEGRYGTGAGAVELERRGGELYLVPLSGGPRLRLRARGDTLVADDRLGYGTRVLPLEGALLLGADTLRRAERPLPAALPEAWRGLVGEYGWAHAPLYVLERGGTLTALTDWFDYAPLQETAPGRFRFPERGPFAGEEMVFERDGAGRAAAVRVGGVVFPRRDGAAAGGETFRITPVRPVEELRPEALAAEPPRESGKLEPDLVELTALDPTIRLDLRYATTNNFMGSVFYTEARAFLQRPAAEALVRAHRALGALGYGLLVHDAYRPWHVTRMFWDATPAHQRHFVADPARGSRHNRGAAVDVTLFDLATGEPLAMPSGYDEFTDRAYADYPGGTSRQRRLRAILRRAMEAEGFRVYGYEWWHFDHRDWARYPVLDLHFDQIRRAAPRPE